MCASLIGNKFVTAEVNLQPTPLGEVVGAYIRCGNARGFAVAECILAEYLPDNVVEGTCADVAPADRLNLFIALSEAANTPQPEE